MRFRRVRINHRILLAIFTQGSEIGLTVVEGIPPNAKFIRITSDEVAGIDIIVEHESFTELNDGDIVPFHPEIRIKKWQLQDQLELPLKQ